MSDDARSKKRRRVLTMLTAVVSTVIALVAAEFAADAWAGARTGRFPDYPDTWRSGGLGPGGYLKENFEATVSGERGGVRWKNNSQGFRYEHDLDAPPRPGVVRILVLGDSFAAGYRVDQTETYAHRLEEWLRSQGVAAEVPIAVIEEPVTGLYWLHRWGLRYRPDVVILGLCIGNDIAQSYLALDPRGTYSLSQGSDGNNKIDTQIDTQLDTQLDTELDIKPLKPARPLGFKHGLEVHDLPADALVDDPPAQLPKNRTPRLVELMFGPSSRAIRPFYGTRRPHKLFDVYNGFGVFLRQPPAEITTAYRRLFRALDGYRTWCRQQNVKFAVLLSAQRYQVHPVDWQVAVDGYGLRPEAFDLDGPNRRIRQHCKQSGIVCLDPTPDMQRWHRQLRVEYFFTGGDMHWNAAGHEAAARAVRGRLAQLVRR